MEYLKMLSLAAVAPMALMAFGVGSASASKLCTTNEPCPVGHSEWPQTMLPIQTQSDRAGSRSQHDQQRNR